MDTNKLNDIHGIIIKEIKYRNTSKILTVFTNELGKISIMAQGAYRKNSPLSSITNNYSIIRYNLSPGKNFYYIRDGILEENNFFLTKSMKLYIISGFISEFIDKTIRINCPEQDIYNLLLVFLKNIKEDEDFCQIAFIAFLLKYSSFMGFRPMLRGCNKCRSTIDGNYYFIITEGSSLCTNCLLTSENSIKLSKTELIFLDNLLHLPMKKSREIFKKYLNSVNLKKLTNLALDYSLYNFEINELKISKWLNNIGFI